MQDANAALGAAFLFDVTSVIAIVGALCALQGMPESEKASYEVRISSGENLKDKGRFCLPKLVTRNSKLDPSFLRPPLAILANQRLTAFP